MLNPALAGLAVLIGDWRLTLSEAPWLAEGQPLSGTATIEWLDGWLLVERSEFEESKLRPPTSLSVVGRNESREDYELLYADDRGVSRVFRMTFADRVWTQHREDPGFFQHFEGVVDHSGNGIDGAWTDRTTPALRGFMTSG